METLAVIETKDLTKVFGKIVAVDRISFTVEEGEIFGFLGPNGAGKTTTINMLTTLMNPTEGTAKIFGMDVVKDANKVRNVIGLVPQDLTVDEDLTGMENMELQASLYHVPKDIAKKRIDEVLSLVELKEAAKRKVETYSGGMRKRLEIAQGLIHHPKLLFLDEPTLGLDVQTRTVIWDYIKKLKEEHEMTIFMTTHYMEEADALCDRIAIIDYGKIKVSGKPKELKDNLGGDIIELALPYNSRDITEAIATIPYVLDVKRKSETYRIKVAKGEEALPDIIERILKMNLKVSKVSLTKPTLDQVYLEYTGRSLRETEGSREEVWRARRNIRRLRR
ncbi:MAG: ATP-binding cassette domain-containing protein [archaeon]|nr:ATP-binding cassette domain-containing protein [archaeon]